jgi:membrane fusion protein (multidrug efflux system)
MLEPAQEDRSNPPVKERDHDDHRDRSEREPERTRWPLIAVAVAVVVGAIGAGGYWYVTKDQQSTDDAYTDGRAVMISPHVSGYVTQLAIKQAWLAASLPSAAWAAARRAIGTRKGEQET